MYVTLFALLFLCVGLESEFQIRGIKRFLFFSVSLLFFIIQGFNTWSPDFDNYIVHFKNIENDYVINALEPVHIFLIRLVKALGGTISTFFVLYGFLIIFFYTKALGKLTPFPIFVLANFFLIPFFPNIVQIRFFLAFALFINAIINEKSRIKFFGFLLLAILTHYSFLVFLPFLILRRFAFFNDLKKNTLLIFAAVVILFLIPKSDEQVYLPLVNEKYLGYLDENSSFLGTLALFLPFFIANIFTLYYHKNIYLKNNDEIESKYKGYIPVIVQLIQFSNYLIIMQYFIRDFSRMSMNLYVFNIIYFTIILSYKKNMIAKQNAFLYKALIFLWTFVCFSVSFFIINQGEYFKIIRKTIESNSIYGWIS